MRPSVRFGGLFGILLVAVAAMPSAQAFDGHAFAFAFCSEDQNNPGVFALFLIAEADVSGDSLMPAHYEADAIISVNNPEGMSFFEDKNADVGSWPVKNYASADAGQPVPILAREGYGGAAKATAKATPLLPTSVGVTFYDYEATVCQPSGSPPVINPDLCDENDPNSQRTLICQLCEEADREILCRFT